jgi:hypothetical protein
VDFPEKSRFVSLLFADRILVGLCSPHPLGPTSPPSHPAMKHPHTSLRRQDLSAALLVTAMLTLFILL